MISPKVLLPSMFKMFRVHDKVLRKLVFHHIIADIVRINEKKLDVGLNRYLQNFMYQMLKDPNRVAAKKSLDVMIQLYHKKVWNDERSINVIATACLFDDSNILTAALKFFLGTNSGVEDEDEIRKNTTNAKRIYAKDTVDKFKTSKSKKTAKKENKYKKALKKFHKSEKDLEKISEVESKNVIEMLNDPQQFCEKLFGKLKNTNQRFEIRIMMMDVISRCIANHKLILLNFYPYFQKYLEPYQMFVTRILAICAQSSHELVPPEVLEPIVMTIANHFVTDRSSPEAITSGINTIREICARQPLVMTTTLLSDLTKYIKAKNRYIVHSARGLITLFRRVSPMMLKKKDRGRGTDLSKTIPQYGHQEIPDGIDGIELLQAFREGKIDINLDEDDEDDDDSEGWVDIEEEITEEELKESLKMLENNKDKTLEEIEEENDDDEENDEITEDEINKALVKQKKKGKKQESEEEEDSDEEEYEISESDILKALEKQNKKGKQNVKTKKGKKQESESDEDDEDEDNYDITEQDILNALEKQRKKGKQDSSDSDSEEEEEEEDIEEEPEEIEDEEEKEDIEEDEEDDENNQEEEIEEDERSIKEKKQNELKEKAKKMTQQQILTDEDFILLNKLKRRKELQEQSKSKLKPKEIVDLKDIESSIKKSVRELKLDGELPEKEREKWQRKERTSTTNRQKLKNKPFMLAKHSRGVRKKNKMGLQEKSMKQYKARKKNLKFSLKHF